MPPKSQGESKQGLIITLVFFILATIGLGVATYFGFSEQEKQAQEVTKAKADAKIFQDHRDWYKFQSQMYRSYMGKAQGLEGAAGLDVKKAEFERGSMKSDKDKDDVTKLLKDLEKNFKWNGNAPAQTYEGELAKMRKEYEALEKRNQGLQASLAAEKKKNDEVGLQLADAQKAYTDNLDKLKKVTGTEQQDNVKALDDLRAKVTQQGAAQTAAVGKVTEDNRTLTAKLAKKDDDIKTLKIRIREQDQKIAQFEVKSTLAPLSMRTDWKILTMDRRGTNPYINLGSADKVRPQLTFSIHGVGLDGRPNPQAKGTLEVVNVVSEHVSRTRITSVKDPDREPILEGDVLYNPSWNPTIKKHVALAGLMDLTGDGRDSLAEFMRNLDRQNVVVDAWLDPKDGSIHGKITVRTDFLILGESQEFSESGRAKAEDNKLTEGRRKMENEAKENGVRPLSLSKYLEMIGYRLPRSTSAERRSLYDPSLRPSSAPRRGDKPPPRMVPDK